MTENICNYSPPLPLLPGEEVVLHQLPVEAAGEEPRPGPGEALHADLRLCRGEEGELEDGRVPGLPDLNRRVGPGDSQQGVGTAAIINFSQTYGGLFDRLHSRSEI